MEFEELKRVQILNPMYMYVKANSITQNIAVRKHPDM